MIFAISLRSSLYRSTFFAASTQIILEFHLPPKISSRIAISVYDAQSLEGYQIKGTAEYVSEGAVVDTFKAMVEKMFNGAATAKGALIITPEKVIVTTPGAENKKVL